MLELGKHLEVLIGLSSAVQKCRDWQQERQSTAVQVLDMQAKCKTLEGQVLCSPLHELVCMCPPGKWWKVHCR